MPFHLFRSIIFFNGILCFLVYKSHTTFVKYILKYIILLDSKSWHFIYWDECEYPTNVVVNSDSVTNQVITLGKILAFLNMCFLIYMVGIIIYSCLGWEVITQGNICDNIQESESKY